MLHEYIFGLTTSLLEHKDVHITVGASTIHTYLRGLQLRRLHENFDVVLIQPPLSVRLKNIAARVLSRVYERYFSSFDLLHLNELSVPYCHVAVYMVNKPKVVTYHNHMLAVESDHWQLSYLREVFSEVDAVVVPSEFMAKVIREKVGYNPIVIYHGVNTSVFRPIHPSYAREKLGIPSDRRVVLWQQRISPEKDLKTLIDAIPLVVEAIPSALFIIRGRAVGHADYRKHILAYAKRKLSSLRENVKLTLRYVRREELPYYYAASDVFVLTSRLEAFGLTLAEAMACGTPVVAANAATASEIMGDAGLLFKVGNSEDLAGKIINVLSNKNLRKELGTKALKRVLENFNWSKAARKYLDLYLSLVT